MAPEPRSGANPHIPTDELLNALQAPETIGGKKIIINGETKMKYEVTVENGTTKWRVNGELHREDGPAVENADGYKAWWINGELHREDGPAVEYTDGSKSWYINGKQIPEPTLLPEILVVNGITYSRK